MLPEKRKFERKCRGALMHKKLDFDCEEDREFWTQEFFQDPAEDYEYEEETDTSSEEVDSDFDDAEEHTEDEQAAEQAVRKQELLERRKDRKKTKYVDPALKRKPPAPRPGAKGRKALEKEELKGEGETKAADDAEEPSKPKKKKPKVEDDSADEPTTRRSSRPQTAAKSTALKQRIELEETWKEDRPQRSRRARKRKGMTQEQRLAEAKRTAEENTASLAKLLHREEEEKTKRRAAIRRRVTTVSGPAVRIDDRIRDGEHAKTVSFRDCWPQVFEAAKRKPEEPASCVITGRKMRYRDSLSGQPCADLEAFHELRKWYKFVWSSVPTKVGGGKPAGSRNSEPLSLTDIPASHRKRFNAVFPRCLLAVLAVQGQDFEAVEKAIQGVVHELLEEGAQQDAIAAAPAEDVRDDSPAPLVATPAPAKPKSPQPQPPEGSAFKARHPHPLLRSPPPPVAPLAPPLAPPVSPVAAQQTNFPTAAILDQLSMQRQQLMYQQFFMPPAARAMSGQPAVDASQALAMYPAMQYYNTPFTLGNLGQWNNSAMYPPAMLPMLYQQFGMMAQQPSKPPDTT